MKKKKRKKLARRLAKKKRCIYQTVCYEDVKPQTLTCFADLDSGFVRTCPFMGREETCGEPGDNLIRNFK